MIAYKGEHLLHIIATSIWLIFMVLFTTTMYMQCCCCCKKKRPKRPAKIICNKPPAKGPLPQNIKGKQTKPNTLQKTFKQGKSQLRQDIGDPKFGAIADNDLRSYEDANAKLRRTRMTNRISRQQHKPILGHQPSGRPLPLSLESKPSRLDEPHNQGMGITPDYDTLNLINMDDIFKEKKVDEKVDKKVEHHREGMGTSPDYDTLNLINEEDIFAEDINKKEVNHDGKNSDRDDDNNQKEAPPRAGMATGDDYETLADLNPGEIFLRKY